MTLLEQFCSGEPLSGEFILDHHMHIGKVAKFFAGQGTVEEIISKMDLLGVNLGMISCLASESGDMVHCNRKVLMTVEQYPDRFTGYIMLNPRYPDGYQQEIDYCWDSGCFKGIKLHPVINQYPIDGDFYLKIYSLAADKPCPVLIHTWGVEDIHKFDALAVEFPDTLFILGHSGGELPAVLEAIKLARKHKNLYLDTTCTWMYCGLLKLMVSEAGAEKCLFGSDVNWNSLEAGLGRVLFAEIDDDQKRMIIGLNMKEILRL